MQTNISHPLCKHALRIYVLALYAQEKLLQLYIETYDIRHITIKHMPKYTY